MILKNKCGKSMEDAHLHLNGKMSEVTRTNCLRKKTCKARLGRRQRSSGKAWSKGWGNEVVPSVKPRV